MKCSSSKEVALDQKGVVENFKDKDGIEQVLIRSPRGASLLVSLHGGQVLSWKTERGEELLFISSKSKFKPPNSVRGGIPICFPQFGKGGALEQHGFARNKMWVTDADPPALPPHDSVGKSFVDLLLKSNDVDMKTWLHSEVRVEGLETLDYLDNLFQRERFTEQGDALTFESEVDRLYVDSKDVVAVYDHEKKRTFHIIKEGLPDIAVWNPWDKKSKSMTDLGDDEYKRMLCVDGAAAERPITLKPGEEWTGRLELIFVRAS
ncbi:unnamed protein product [Rhodiola kirilowii]